MTIRSAFSLAILLCLAGTAMPAFGAGQGRHPPPEPRELIYGAELMSHPERERYRARWRGAANPEAREQIRRQHRAQMQERARKRGMNIGESGVVEAPGVVPPAPR